MEAVPVIGTGRTVDEDHGWERPRPSLRQYQNTIPGLRFLKEAVEG
ncbi:hypothetical protein IH879_21000 [candidate division KSB1 bacterium]|nr:hypothetical protein [candidate division KSB1 bacterium]